MFVKYKTVNDILSSYRRNRPISAIQSNNKKIYAIIQHSQGLLHAFHIRVSYLKTYNSLSMNFHQVEINENITDLQLRQIDESSFKRYILLLPELSRVGYNTISGCGSYYIIDSEWNELNPKIQFVPPQAPHCTYYK